MKKLLLLLLLSLTTVSCVNYYSVTVNTDTILYSTENNESPANYTIPSGSSVYIKGKKYRKYRKIKYGNYVGWAYSPNYTSPNQYSSQSTSSSNTRSSSSSYTSSGKTVNVKGYYRKNGTYVKPHTRSAPRRR